MGYRFELIRNSSKRQWQAKLSGIKFSSSTLIKKDIASKISLDSWGVWQKRKGGVWTPLFPSLLGVGIHIYCLPALAPVKTTPRSSWEALVALSVVQSPSGWLWLGVWKAEALLASKKGMGFIRWKVNLLTCEAAVSIYSGQMPVPKASYPSSRTESHLPFPHPNPSKQDTEKHRK